MKDRRFILIRWVCILLILLCCSQAALAEMAMYFGKSRDDAYEEMEAHFGLKEYEAAAALIEEYGLAESDYRDAKLYKQYCQAWICMEKGNLEEAAQLLKGLKGTSPKFYDCEVFYYYAEGRLAQQQKKYEAAKEYYDNAIIFQDAAQRSLECSQLLKEQRKTQAEELFDSGVETRNTEALRQAAQLYRQLNDTQMEESCIQAIAQIEDETALQNAILEYESAVKQKDVDMLQESYRFFSSRPDEKSQQLAGECKAEIDKLNRSMTAMVKKEGTTELEIAIEDTMTAAGGYMVSYGPRNNKPSEITVMEKTVHLTGLLPDTEYAVTVQAADWLDTPITLTAKTAKAEKFDENGFTVKRRRLVGINDQLLQIKTLDEIWNEVPEKVDRYDDYKLSLEDEILSLKEYSYYYWFDFEQTESVEQLVSERWIIRSPENGVVVSETEQHDFLPKNGKLQLKINQLLDELYANKNSWPSQPCVVEVYINDRLAGEGMLTIYKK